MNLTPLADTEWNATLRKHADRVNALRSRGWGRPTPFTRHDIKTNFAIDRWHMQQGIGPEEQK